ncbi:MAG: hypothetical protein QT09_C0010G0026 [archaeon GW2011_AR18]|nr:MAG: hypothetical protein QT09_C0010G0026 [archaeon GW2011_AR18]
MLGKKGADFGMGLTMIPSIIILIIILTFYFFLFIILGFGKSPDLIIKADSYSDSSKILVLVNVPIGESTLSESIINNIDDKEQLKKLEPEINSIIKSLPVPIRKNAFWNFIVSRNDEELFSIRESTIASSDYYRQSINIPLKDKSLLNMELYLDCNSCTEEDLAVI